MKIQTNLKAGNYYEGSFMNSCDDISQDESYDGSYTNINASCRQENGAWNFTSIGVPWNFYGDINNCDGDLVLGGCY